MNDLSIVVSEMNFKYLGKGLYQMAFEDPISGLIYKNERYEHGIEKTSKLIDFFRKNPSPYFPKIYSAAIYETSEGKGFHYFTEKLHNNRNLQDQFAEISIAVSNFISGDLKYNDNRYIATKYGYENVPDLNAMFEIAVKFTQNILRQRRIQKAAKSLNVNLEEFMKDIAKLAAFGYKNDMSFDLHDDNYMVRQNENGNTLVINDPFV